LRGPLARRDWVFATVVLLTVCGAQSSSGQRGLIVALPTPVPRPRPVCAAPARPHSVLGAMAGAPVSDNTPFAYEQFPPILVATETGTIRVVAEVVGDVPVVTFRRNVPMLGTGYITETWTRDRTRAVDGRLISVFDQRYPGSILADLLVYSHGNDFPQVPLGRLEVPGSGIPDLDGASAAPSFVTLWLRLAPSNLPVSTVLPIAPTDEAAPTGQYASHVVNIVMPGFGERQVPNGAQAFELEEAAQAFYRHFADTYHTLSFIPRRSPFGAYAGFNVNVKNDVEGIGTPLVDTQAAYTSRTLRSVQLYVAGFAGQHATTVHQTGHQWGDETDLAGIAGVSAAGRQPGTHTPLLGGGATLLGAVLQGTREVESIPPTVPGSATNYRIGRTPAPVRFHPLQLYRMGFLEPSAVPAVTVFDNQSQFDSDRASTPEVGTPVTGEPRTIHINEIIAALGPRRGPTFTEWHQAFIVVSDELISEEEMDYYNFYAQRAAVATGTQSYDGYGSFAEATGNRVTLRTAIDPRDAAGTLPIAQTLPVSHVPFGRWDWRGLVLDTEVPSHLAVGESVSWTGSIDPQFLPDQYEFIVWRATRYGDASADATIVRASVRGGRFSIPVQFGPDQVGAYEVDIFVFENADSPAISTSVLTPLFVE